jgi:hypothetical protein
MEHPEEIDRVAAMKQKVNDVKGIMMDNIEKVIERGEKIEVGWLWVVDFFSNSTVCRVYSLSLLAYETRACAL